jgi:DNA-binding SARP family transcriptional activator
LAASFKRGAALADYNSGHALTLNSELPFVLSSAEIAAANVGALTDEPNEDRQKMIETLQALLASSSSAGETSANLQAAVALCRTLLGVGEARRNLDALQDSEAVLISLIEKLTGGQRAGDVGHTAIRGLALPLLLGPWSEKTGDETPVVPDTRGQSGMRVRLLGRFDVEMDGTPLPAWRSRRARQLLQYLLLHHGEEISRHRLMGLFWPEHSEERAENNLSLTVMALRRVLDQTVAGSGARVAFRSGAYHLELSELWLDSDAFDAAFDRGHGLEKAGDATGAAEAFDAAIALYGGDLLPGELYEEWTTSRRQRLQDRFLEALQRRAVLARLDGDLDLSIRLNQRILETDPAQEAAHRQLVLDYLATGQRSRAAQQLEACREALRRHLGEEPDGETLALLTRAGQINRESIDNQG